MNKKDKDSFLIVIATLVMVLMAITFYFTSKYVNPLYIGIVVIIIQCLYITPRLTRLYFKLFNVNIGVTRYIPLWNELICFKPIIANITLASWVLIVFMIILSFLDPSIVAKIFGEHFALNYTFNILKVTIIIYLFNNIIRGIGLCGVTNTVNQFHADLVGVSFKVNILGVLSNILYFIPICRAMSMVQISDRLQKLVELNNYTSDEEEFYMEECDHEDMEENLE